MMKHILLICTALSLSACSTVKLPDLNLAKLSDFRNERIKGDYPDVSEAPEVPTDTRSDKAWDRAAKDMVALKNGFEVTNGDFTPATPQELDARFEALKNKVHAYKADDPAG